MADFGGFWAVTQWFCCHIVHADTSIHCAYLCWSNDRALCCHVPPYWEHWAATMQTYGVALGGRESSLKIDIFLLVTSRSGNIISSFASLNAIFDRALDHIVDNSDHPDYRLQTRHNISILAGGKSGQRRKPIDFPVRRTFSLENWLDCVPWSKLINTWKRVSKHLRNNYYIVSKSAG